jgi:group II intron reverse transcriptase/maturase
MTIHSNDGKSWQTKLDHINELSAQNASIVFNNLGHLINQSGLKKIFHLLDGSKAVGIDGVTKAKYGRNLDENIEKLILRIRRGTYRPQAAKLVEIPKEDGSSRPLAISCLEDKLVQLAVNEILMQIYEPLFLPNSYGFRPGKNCHDALRALNHNTYRFSDGAVVEIDLRKYFNSIPHDLLLDCLRKKISDKRFLRLVEILLKTPTRKGDEDIPNEIGCPQGSCISPVLANLYLHVVMDCWFEDIKHTHLKGKAELVRYADDMVFVFQHMSEAERFYRVLPKRLEKYGLSLHQEKSQLLPSGRMAAARAIAQGQCLPTYKFLGFVCYWGKGRNGFLRLKFTGRGDRFTAKLKEVKDYLRENLNTKDTPGIITRVVLIVRGWINYYV